MKRHKLAIVDPRDNSAVVVVAVEGDCTIPFDKSNWDCKLSIGKSEAMAAALFAADYCRMQKKNINALVLRLIQEDGEMCRVCVTIREQYDFQILDPSTLITAAENIAVRSKYVHLTF